MSKLIGLGCPGVPFLVVGGGAPSVQQLAAEFLDGAAGAYYDFTAGGSLWQDTGGSIAAGVGDPVGRVDDLGGGDNNAVQADNAARPVRTSSGISTNGTSQFLDAVLVGAASQTYLMDVTFASSYASLQRLAGHNNGASSYNNVAVTDTGVLRFGPTDTPANVAGGRHTVALIRSGSDWEIAVDGVSVASGSIGGSMSTVLATYIAALNTEAFGTISHFEGVFHRFGIVDRAMSVAETADFHAAWSAA
ncbi:hypothetical protein [Marinibacterium sp. SX1]|uniref:hypothetical protein n=1 Tax=Marinibacterium sp. SX1 TaxID=3388424 RepID=UPI003D175998